MLSERKEQNNEHQNCPESARQSNSRRTGHLDLTFVKPCVKANDARRKYSPPQPESNR